MPLPFEPRSWFDSLRLAAKIKKVLPIYSPASPWRFITAGLFFALFVIFAGTPALAQTVLDRESMECINCHDVALKGADPVMICHGDGCDHPIGGDYTAAAASRGDLRPMAALSPSIRFSGARMGCTSCHIPYDVSNHRQLYEKKLRSPESPDPFLSVDNRGSGLCLACHMK